MTRTGNSILDAVGGTPLVTLEWVVPPNAARVVVKLESANPTGSMKDRLARELVRRAAADGRLPSGGTAVDYTGGTTGVSLAFVCAALGYSTHFVFSDAFSDEKRQTMRAYGAAITDVPSEHGRITRDLITTMIGRAEAIAARPGHWWCNQLHNCDGQAAYHELGEEMWRQAERRVDAFVHMVGSAHSLHGTAYALRQQNPTLHVVAVEPTESPVLSGGPPGAHRIEGVGIGFVPPLWNPRDVDEIQTVSTDDANAMARRLARDEGLFVGTSSGANITVALRLAARLGPEATVGTIAIDSGLRYVSTGLFHPPDA